MKRLILLLIVLAAALTACASPAEPTATPSAAPVLIGTPLVATLPPPSGATPAQGDVVTPVPQELALAATLALGDAVTFVPVGTLTYAEATEPVDPNAPTPVPPVFQSLEFVQAGGATEGELIVVLQADGTLTRNGVTASVEQSEVFAVAEALSKIRFFDLMGTFTGVPRSESEYRYGLTVFTDQGSRTIEAMEPYTPPELLELFFNLSMLGLQPMPQS